jgi:hypothetical protein
MPFEIKRVLEHGTTKPIVARLSLLILEILKQCNLSKTGRRSVRELAAQDTAAPLGDRALSPFASVCGALCDFGSSFDLFDPASLFQQPGMLKAVSARVALPISAENAYNSRRFGGIWGVRLRLPSRAPRVSGRTPTCKFLTEPVSALSRWSLWLTRAYHPRPLPNAFKLITRWCLRDVRGHRLLRAALSADSLPS